jgi:hypothetical protein
VHNRDVDDAVRIVAVGGECQEESIL